MLKNTENDENKSERNKGRIEKRKERTSIDRRGFGTRTLSSFGNSAKMMPLMMMMIRR